jgi:hypothetical protein
VKKCIAVGFAAALALLPAAGASAEQIKPLKQTKSSQMFARFGGLTTTTTTLSIIAGVVTVGILVASDDSSSTTR